MTTKKPLFGILDKRTDQLKQFEFQSPFGIAEMKNIYFPCLSPDRNFMETMLAAEKNDDPKAFADCVIAEVFITVLVKNEIEKASSGRDATGTQAGTELSITIGHNEVRTNWNETPKPAVKPTSRRLASKSKQTKAIPPTTAKNDKRTARQVGRDAAKKPRKPARKP
jgi:hypothetical protein